MEILRYAAFTDDPAGGNPAGVVLDAARLDDPQMQRIAAEIGYSETAFLVAGTGGHIDVRYFSPRAEVPFCGHATIALAAAHAERNGPGVLHLNTPVGQVQVTTRAPDGAAATATLISVPPRSEPITTSDLTELLDSLNWTVDDLDPDLPPRVAFAGARHPIIATASRERLARLDYDVAALDALMARRDWTTVDLVHRESTTVFHARNPFPPGGVVEDPATGAAAAALGGYLRDLGLVKPPTTVTIHQGHDMGRPSLLIVDVPAAAGTGIAVTGSAVPIPPAA